MSFKTFLNGLLGKTKPAAAEELKPTKVVRPGTGHRLRQPAKHEYKAEFALVYNGKPISLIPVSEFGYSRDKVAKDLSEGLTLKLLSVVQVKPQKPTRLPKKRKN